MKRYIFGLFCFFLSFVYCKPMPEFASASANKKLKVAVCYWGLTRSTKKVYPSHFEKVFNVLDANGIEYDIFMHTWQLAGKQRVWWNEISIPIDYEEYKFLNPKFYRIDNQDMFTNHLDFGKYFYQNVWDKKGDCMDGEWPAKLILNHLCALESQKRVTEMVEQSGNHYDLVMYMRPDVWFFDILDVRTFFDLKENEIIIPAGRNYEGLCDTFAILSYKTAPIYAKRIDHIAEFRKHNGRIVSEKYVKYICDKNNLNVKEMEFNFDIVRP